MPFLDFCRNDVFISYAHADNKIGPSGTSWVSQFTSYLDTSLQQRLGCGDSMRVYFDNRDLHANHEIEELLNEVKNSAVFVAICSPSYVRRDWTRREIDAFSNIPNSKDRLFVVDMLPLDSLDDYPFPLNSKPRAKFWHQDEAESRVAYPLDPKLNPQLYTKRLLDLADQIRRQLLQLQQQGQERQQQVRSEASRAAEESSGSEAGGQNSGGAAGTILLAQTTDELEVEREQVKSYMLQLGIRVLPETDYPQGGEEFKQAFLEDLGNSDLFVQLLGKAVGRRPPDLPDGYVQTQFSLASQAGKSMMLWRHPELDLDQISDEAQRALLTADSVVASGLESFKTDTAEMLKSMKAPSRPKTPSLVYVGSERVDLPIAQQVADSLRSHDYPVVIPTFDGSAEEIRQDLEDNLLESDKLVFVHGTAPTTWIRGNLRRLHKLMSLREKPPQKVAILNAPPEKEGDIGVSLPYVETIDSSTSLEFDGLIAALED